MRFHIELDPVHIDIDILPVYPDNPPFWEAHGVAGGILFLIFMFLFPRLTLLFATPWGPVSWWIGLILIPRFQAAVLGSMLYADTNPVLCIIAWIAAFLGEGVEKEILRKRYL